MFEKAEFQVVVLLAGIAAIMGTIIYKMWILLVIIFTFIYNPSLLWFLKL